MCYSFISAYANLPNCSCHFSKHKLVFFQILHQSSVPSNITPLSFFQLKNDILWSKEPIKGQIFQIFECLSQNLSNSSCQFSNDNKSIPLQILHHSSLSRDISSVNFKLIYFLLWTKGSHQNTNFSTFKRSDENLPNFSCHFSNHKSVFPQILHNSSVS